MKDCKNMGGRKSVFNLRETVEKRDINRSHN